MIDKKIYTERRVGANKVPRGNTEFADNVTKFMRDYAKRGALVDMLNKTL